MASEITVSDTKKHDDNHYSIDGEGYNETDWVIRRGIFKKVKC